MRLASIGIIAIICIFCIPALTFAVVFGPYTGQVIDSKTGKPIEGANVFVYLEGHFAVPPEGYDMVIAVKMVYTDKAGRYEIPAAVVPLELTSIWEDTGLLIYQPGYRVHTDRQDSSRASSSFKKSGYIVKLDRIPPNFNHREQYERMEVFLSHIEHYGWEDPIWGKKLTWDDRIKLNLKSGIIEAEELLRCAEWERRRGELEERK